MEPTGDNWRSDAACRNADPEVFFPTGEKSEADRRQIEEAKSFCVRCLVKVQCLEYALDTNPGFGVWGGMTENEQKALKRRAQMNRRKDGLERERR